MEIVMWILLAAFLFFFITPAQADVIQGKPTVACQTIEGLQKRLQHLTSRTQITSPDWSRELWDSKDGCFVVAGRTWTADRDTAIREIGGPFAPTNLGGFIGWLRVNEWLVPVQHFAFLDKAQETAYRPMNALPADRFTLPPICFRLVVHDFGVPLYGQQFDRRGRKYCGISSVLVR